MMCTSKLSGCVSGLSPPLPLIKLCHSSSESLARALIVKPDIAYYTIPFDESEPRSDQWIVTHLPGRRCISFRPDGERATKAFFMFVTDQSLGYEKLPIPEQIVAIRKHLLGGPDLHSPIVARAAQGLLDGGKDLYLEYTGQIKAKRLSTPSGRISLLGDAAYCGTALSGAGTTRSLTGAYILAGELAMNVDDPKASAQGYEEYMKPFAAEKQNLLPGLPHIALPSTTFGITILHTVVRVLVWMSRIKPISWVLGKVFDDGASKSLPDYSKYELKADE